MKTTIAACRLGTLLVLLPTPVLAQSHDRVQLRFDTTEAVAVLALLGAAPAPDSAWSRLFATEGYRRLVQREAAIRRPFTNADFAAFVRSDTLRRRAPELRATLDAWARADIQAVARRVLGYLPPEARIVATVYPVIKPRTNTFVWETRTNPAIFVYLDPAVGPAEMENTIAHELHHIGFSSVGAVRESLMARLPERARLMADWSSALGEGFAMLAAAGGPDVHPHATSSAATRARWDADAARFNDDLRALDAFFAGILAGRYPSEDSVRAVGMTFFGEQGAWYTVGWRMAVLIERQLGRDELIRCMSDPYRLLSTWNRLAAAHNATHADSLASWSAGVVDQLRR